MRFVYCVDKNFNYQLATSIFSLLKNVNEEIDITILHEDSKSFLNIKSKLEKLPNIKNIEIFDVDIGNTSFPKIKNSHVSKATYFRLFIPRYVNHKEHLVYLDADTIIIKNPLAILKKQIKQLDASDKFISACIETTKEASGDIFERLDLQSVNYFNAGVMIINGKLANRPDVTSEMINTMESLDEKIKYWDQDVINKHFDLQIKTLDNRLNIKIDDNSPKLNYDLDPHIVHYAGSSKPWTLEGLLDTDSHFFQNSYLELLGKNIFFMTTNWKIGTLKLILKEILTFSIFQRKNYLKIIVSTFILLISRRA